MPYAEVSVNSPIASKQTFSYAIPTGLSVTIGQAVWVPFGEKTLQGIVVALTDHPAVEQTRDISGLIDPLPLLSLAQIKLAQWLSQYYLTPLFEAIALMLPPAFERRVVISLMRTSLSIPGHELQPYLDCLSDSYPTNQKLVEKHFGLRKTQKAIAQLLREKLVIRSYSLEKERIKPRLVTYVKLKLSQDEARQAQSELPARRLHQMDLLDYLIDHPQPVLPQVLKEKAGIPASTISAFLKKGWLEKVEVRVERDPLAGRDINLTFPLTMTPLQEKAFQEIQSSLLNKPSPEQPPDVFLLFGVTGSGKTEIYLRSLAETVKMGRKGLVLVPEIAMTPQIIERFVSRFPGRVAVLHSELTLGEQFDEWWRIKKGEFDVVIGPRSALFAPQPDLGLIILDEEHEWSYKQQDSPRYHAREAAIRAGALNQAVVVLGSATPDIESYQRARQGQYRLLELPDRVAANGAAFLPRVEVVDLRAELKAYNLSLFSRSLRAAITLSLENKEQIILFLNRRGSASFVECRNCGLVIRCKRCETPLSYHFHENNLICHRCNFRTEPPRVCPRCKSLHIKYLGVGTEKLEQETAQAFPQARILRWDSDALKEKGRSHQTIFEKFRAGEADILIGTQMIAKGLDLPKVTLVGVVSADVSLNLPDFRAGERTFQLLCQVAGRAGRGTAAGQVIIQTYVPEHYAIQAAAGHDYAAFFTRELEYRRRLRYPPFIRLARLLYFHPSDHSCQVEAEKMRQQLLDERDARGLADVSLIGPAPAFTHRLRNKFRWQLIVRAADPAVFLSSIHFPRGWSIDIDPVGLA
jgi:primosomal protein N' (replication factor Y) (superfamily II helicase)